MRRLHLAAQAGETLLFMIRPLAAAQDSSSAPLRLSLRPASGGLNVGFVKRQGPALVEPMFLPMQVGSSQVFKRQPLATSGRIAKEHVLTGEYERELNAPAVS